MRISNNLTTYIFIVFLSVTFIYSLFLWFTGRSRYSTLDDDYDYDVWLQSSHSNYHNESSLIVDHRKTNAFDWYWRTEGGGESSVISFKSIIELRKGYRNVQATDEDDKSESLMEILSKGSRVSFFFDRCRMTNCFDFSRCPPNKKLKVNIVPSIFKRQEKIAEDHQKGESNVIYQEILQIIKNSEYYEPNSTNSCVFVPEDDTLDRDPLSPSFEYDLNNLIGSQNKYGINYLIFNLYSGTWPDYKENDFYGVNFGAAIIAKASDSLTSHRQGFDISIPLFSYLHPLNDTSSSAKNSIHINEDRNIFLSFKGKRYVTGKGSDTRNSVYHIDNGRDVIMLTTCKHGKKWRESRNQKCEQDEARYDSYDYEILMQNSTFCLTPRGRRLGSFRHLEAMNHGCIPVVLSDGYVKPFEEIIDWSCATVHFGEQFLLLVPELLRDIDKTTIAKMRSCNLELYAKYFSSIERIILTTLSVLEKRINNHYNM